MNLKEVFRKGFLAGPHESKEVFEKRINASENLTNIKKLLPEDAILKKLDDTLYYFKSNKKLPLWTAALTWIIEIEKGVKIPILQLPKTPRRFSFASQDEVIAHEKVHALRAAFEEPMFEEIIAYRTSTSKFRRFMGPLFSTTKESGAFLITLLTFPFIRALPAIVFFLLFIRLFYRQSLFAKALKNLGAKKEMISYLTDNEIKLAAKNQFDFLNKKTLRLKQIKELTEDYNVNYVEEKNATV